MAWRSLRVAFVAVVLGCGGDVRLEAEPAQIKADGVSFSRITFYDDADDDGATVDIETDRGHFLDEDGYEVQYVTRSLSNGRANAELYSTIRPGIATVTATSSSGQTATVTVEFLQLRPSGRSLSFECDSVNIGALREPVPDLAVPCHLRMQDAAGAVIDPRGLPSDSYGFIAEAGIVDPLVREDYEEMYFLYTSTGGARQPYDVEPIDGEPSRSGDTGGTRNPRDGLVTLVAWVRGEEGFHDINLNGIFEPENRETFIDQGEPFVDVNDDGEFNPADGDLWQDLDGDDRYTEPNGVWDSDTLVWTTFKLLWTGPIHESPATSRIQFAEGDSRDVPPSATRMVVVTLLDHNLNPIAAQGEGYDSANLYAGCSSCTISGTTSPILESTRGFDVDAAGQVVGNLFEAPSYSFSITNNNSYAEPESFTITVSGDATPAPLTSDGNYPTTYHFELEPFEARLLGSGE
jgi:hypothetical protein